MKKSLNRKLGVILSLVLAFTMMVGTASLAVFAKESEEDSKLADYFGEVMDEYIRNTYELAYQYADENGYVDSAIDMIDELVEELVAVDATENGALKKDVDALIDSLEELKVVLENDEVATVEALVEKARALIDDLYARLESIDELTEIRNTLGKRVLPALKNLVDTIAEKAYGPLELLAEALLDREINSEAELVAALKELDAMDDEERAELFADVIQNATHADYEVNCGSYYVAFGDNTVSGRKNYVTMLAKELGVDFKTVSGNVTIEGLADMIAANKSEVAKADLITIGFGGTVGLLEVIDRVMSKETNNDLDWDQYLGQAVIEAAKDAEKALAELYDQLAATDVDADIVDAISAYVSGVKDEINEQMSSVGIDGDAAAVVAATVEVCVYKYVSYAFAMHEAVCAIEDINADALIVVVGMYNPLTDVVITTEEESFEIGSYIDYLFEVIGAYDLAYAIVTESTTFVAAPDVEVQLTEKKMGAEDLIKAITTLDGKNLMPTGAGQEYIAEQILNALNITTGDHVFGDWSETKAATCTEKGEETRTCSICGEIETKETDALDHDWKWITDEEAGCEKPGHKHEECTRCGETREESDIPAGEHAFGDWVTTKEPTCKEKGVQTRTCGLCGAIETKELDMLEHSFGDWVTTKEPTCGQKGTSTRTCSLCGDTETKDIDALTHDWYWVVEKEATYDETGLKYEQCSICGEKRNETVIPKLETPPTGDIVTGMVVVAVTMVVAIGAGVSMRKRYNDGE